MQLPTEWMELTNNMDVMVMMAERHYYNCNYQESYAITKRSAFKLFDCYIIIILIRG